MAGLAAALLLLAPAARAEVVSAPGTVYVANFELAAENVKPESGVLANRPRPLKRILGQAPGEKDPETEARELVDLMAGTLVEDLTKAGFQAVRLYPGATTPAQGWLVRGIFVKVDQGNRLQRAVVGFGAGETELKVEAALDNLAGGAPQPFYDLTAGDESRKLPGGIVMRNPYAMAARFVMSRNDLEKNVKNTASEIAKSIAAQIRK